jgi:pheromone shutdown protein TraB
MNEEFVRRLPDAELTLVGVVHDHPASVHRARAVVRERAPEVVALEAPPLAVPLYETYADDSRTPPAFGGEMSAAAQAASERDAEVVGIDAPTPDFFARLAANCWSEAASLGTLRRVASGVAAVTRHALTCRLAAGVAERTSLRVEVDDPIDHDCSRTDPPAVQARDEREQARRSQSLLRAFDPPRPVKLRDETREECMAERLESLRSRGETVAIVGLDHLESVAATLREK